MFDISLSVTFSVTKSMFCSDSPSLVLALPESVGLSCTDSGSLSEFSELCHGSILLPLFSSGEAGCGSRTSGTDVEVPLAAVILSAMPLTSVEESPSSLED